MNDEIIGMTDEQASKFNEAERTITEWRALGKKASSLLYEARHGVAGIDWFDHRHHLLSPEIEFTDFWAESGCNILRKMPIDGTLLDLCCGDGFYDFHFFRHRARSIIGIDINRGAIALARREHSAPNIEYIVGDIRDYPIAGQYDIIVCRGAIEHFTSDEQAAIFSKVKAALKVGGWFCGDTVIGDVTNSAHKHEWASKEEMDIDMRSVFETVESDILVSRTRTTLLWRAQ